MAWPHPLMGSWGPYSFFLMFCLTPRGHDALLQVGLIFAPCVERLVHRNHKIGVVRLIEVDGYFKWDPISSPIDVEFGCASSRDIP